MPATVPRSFHTLRESPHSLHLHDTAGCQEELGENWEEGLGGAGKLWPKGSNVRLDRGTQEMEKQVASSELGVLGTSWGHSSVNCPDLGVQCMGSEVSLPGFKSWLPRYQLTDLREIILPL